MKCASFCIRQGRVKLLRSDIRFVSFTESRKCLFWLSIYSFQERLCDECFALMAAWYSLLAHSAQICPRPIT